MMVAAKRTGELETIEINGNAFICRCGGKRFAYAPLKTSSHFNIMMRPESRCTKCDRRYIFVKRLTANGTTV